MNGRTICRGFTLAVAAGAMVLSGCSTVEYRIKDNPQVFQSLPPRDQELVNRGQIRIGMSTDGAWLAWGSPDQKIRGAMKGGETETWIYTTSSGYGGGYGGYGYGPYWGGGPWWGGGFGGVGVFRAHGGHRFFFYGSPFYDPFYYSYIPSYSYPYKTVTFSNGRVVSFQTLVAPYR
ncbi:MAG TPA: hypothetical protein VGM62_19730 [Chthoniobacterales bacterium]